MPNGEAQPAQKGIGSLGTYVLAVRTIVSPSIMQQTRRVLKTPGIRRLIACFMVPLLSVDPALVNGATSASPHAVSNETLFTSQALAGRASLFFLDGFNRYASVRLAQLRRAAGRTVKRAKLWDWKLIGVAA